MAGDGHYWQQALFYCSHWTPEIEGTLVESLLDHHRNGTFHCDRTNCHAVMCACFDINAKYGSTFAYSYLQRRLTKLKIRHRVFQWIIRLAAVEWDPTLNVLHADDYVWEQISKAKKIGKAYVRAAKPHWNALILLFGECGSDDNVEDEQQFFDPSGTCVDDGWVYEAPASADECSEYESDSYMEASTEDDPSWWAFMQEYYASDTDTGSVNKVVGTVHRPPSSNSTPSPMKPSSHNSNATPSSCASNDPDVQSSSPSPLLDRCLIRRPPKKRKF